MVFERGCMGVRLNTRAFTLIELVLVTAIMLVLSLIALPRFGASLEIKRIDSAAQRIAGDLELAQRRARTRSASETVEFLPETSSYRMPGMPHINRSTAVYTVELGCDPYAVKLDSAVFGKDAVLVFDGFGRPDSGGQITITAGKSQRTISVDADCGRASIP